MLDLRKKYKSRNKYKSCRRRRRFKGSKYIFSKKKIFIIKIESIAYLLYKFEQDLTIIWYVSNV